jgi:hypothetical protein
VNPTTTSIFNLSPVEKLQLVEDWQKEELDRRKANLRKNPASGLTWEEVKRRVSQHDQGANSGGNSGDAIFNSKPETSKVCPDTPVDEPQCRC